MGVVMFDIILAAVNMLSQYISRQLSSGSPYSSRPMHTDIIILIRKTQINEHPYLVYPYHEVVRAYRSRRLRHAQSRIK